MIRLFRFLQHFVYTGVVTGPTKLVSSPTPPPCCFGAGWRAFYYVYGLSSAAVPVTPKISKLYWSVAMPKMTYSLEVLTTVPSHIEKLERTHNAIANQIQDIPKHSPNVCIASLRRISVRLYIEIARIMFLWKSLLLKCSCIYKRVAMARLGHHL